MRAGVVALPQRRRDPAVQRLRRRARWCTRASRARRRRRPPAISSRCATLIGSIRTCSPCSVTGSIQRAIRVPRLLRAACRAVSAVVPRHEHQPLEQVDVLLVLQQRAVQRRDDGLVVARAQRFGRNVLGDEQLEPVQQFRGGGLLLQAGQFADLVEAVERLLEQLLLQAAGSGRRRSPASSRDPGNRM